MQSCKYFIHLWWRCSKVKGGISSKVECSWSTGELIIWNVLTLNGHSMWWTDYLLSRSLHWRRSKKLRLNCWDKSRKVMRLQSGFRMRSRELNLIRCNDPVKGIFCLVWRRKLHFVFFSFRIISDNLFSFRFNCNIRLSRSQNNLGYGKLHVRKKFSRWIQHRIVFFNFLNKKYPFDFVIPFFCNCMEGNHSTLLYFFSIW